MSLCESQDCHIPYLTPTLPCKIPHCEPHGPKHPFHIPGAYKGFTSTRLFCSLSFRKILGGKILTRHPLFIQVETVFIFAGHAYEVEIIRLVLIQLLWTASLVQDICKTVRPRSTAGFPLCLLLTMAIVTVGSIRSVKSCCVIYLLIQTKKRRWKLTGSYPGYPGYPMY